MAAEDSEPVHPAYAAIDSARELAKWLIVAFGAIGATIVAGSQLSEMGEIDGWRLFGAFAGLVLGLVGVAIAIWYAAKVLTPSDLTLAQLARSEANSPAGKLVREDPDVLLGHGNTIVQLQSNRKDAIERESSAWSAYEADKADAELKQRAIDAQADRRLVDDAVQQFLPMALYAQVEQTLKTAIRVMFAGAVVAAAGIGLFAWAAHPAESEGTPAPVVAKDPSEVVVRLTNDGRAQLADRLGKGCDLDAVHALAVAGSAAELQVVPLPEDGCETVRFAVTGDVGTVVSGEQIDTIATCPKDNPKPPCLMR
jgi:hypothetical protein